MINHIFSQSMVSGYFLFSSFAFYILFPFGFSWLLKRINPSSYKLSLPYLPCSDTSYLLLASCIFYGKRMRNFLGYGTIFYIIRNLRLGVVH